MKTALLLLTTLSASLSVASGSVIARWDWDHLKQVDDPNLATCISPCVKVTELSYLDLKQGFHPAGGYKDSPFRSWTGWTEEFTAMPEGRTDLSLASGTLWFDVSFSRNLGAASAASTSALASWMPARRARCRRRFTG